MKSEKPCAALLPLTTNQLVNRVSTSRITKGYDVGVAFTVDAHPGRRFAGTVEQIRKAHELFQNVVTYTVIV